MDDLAFGRLVRLARIRRRWRQQDLAERARVSRPVVSRIERGVFVETSFAAVRAVAGALDLRVELHPRARAVDIDRVLNERHAALAEHVLRWLASTPGWVVRPEVSFSEFGERGVIDLLGWHASTSSLLVVELKTEVIDVAEVLGTLDRKLRLGATIAQRLGWEAERVSACLLIADSMTNRRRVSARLATFRAALPDDGRALGRWLRRPSDGEVRGLRFVSDVRRGHTRSSFAAPTRVSRRPEARVPTALR
jgi:transcriptional regulator with XRE-family HTH domain